MTGGFCSVPEVRRLVSNLGVFIAFLDRSQRVDVAGVFNFRKQQIFG